MKKRLFYVACAAVVLAVAGCGGGSGSEQSHIEAAVEAMTLAGRPSKCTAAMTAAAREQSVHEPEPAALKSCEAEAEDPTEHATSASVSEIEIEGDTATANVRGVGGGFGGQVITVSVVRVGGEWKVDRIVRFAHLDAAALGHAFRQQSEEHHVLPPAQARCAQARIENASQAEIEELALTTIPTAKSLRLVASCVR